MYRGSDLSQPSTQRRDSSTSSSSVDPKYRSAFSDHIRDAGPGPERPDPKASRLDSQKASRLPSLLPAVPYSGFQGHSAFPRDRSLSWKDSYLNEAFATSEAFEPPETTNDFTMQQEGVKLRSKVSRSAHRQRLDPCKYKSYESSLQSNDSLHQVTKCSENRENCSELDECVATSLSLWPY